MYDEMNVWSKKQVQNRLVDFFEYYDTQLITQKVFEAAEKDSEGYAGRAARIAAREMGDLRWNCMYQFYDMAVNQGINIGHSGVGDIIEETIDEFAPEDLAKEIKHALRVKILTRWDGLLERPLFNERHKGMRYPVEGKIPRSKDEVAQNDAAKANRAYRKELKRLERENRLLKNGIVAREAAE